MTRTPAWRQSSSPERPSARVIAPVRSSDVIVDDRQKRQGLVRNRSIKLWEAWQATPTRIKVANGIALAAITVIGSLALTYIDPIFVFALTMVIRTAFYALAYWYVERREYDAAVATRSFMAIQVFAYLAVIIDVFETQSTWRVMTFLILAFLLTMEVVGVRTWYSKWMEREHRQMRQMHPFERAMHPKFGSILTAVVCIILEYVVFLIMWSKLLDDIILWSYHALIWMIEHPVESLILIIIAVVIIVVTKIYIVIIWIFANPVSILGIMVIVGVIGMFIH